MSPFPNPPDAAAFIARPHRDQERESADGPAADAIAEARSVRADTVVARLPTLAALRVSGIDAEAFLQGQLGNDVRAVDASRVQLSSYSNPKGRALAILTVLRDADGFDLVLTADLADATLKRLRMFVLRSKVVIEPSPARLFGLSGDGTATALAAVGASLPSPVWSQTVFDGIHLWRQPGGFVRVLGLGLPDAIAALWPRLATQTRPVGPQAFRLSELLDGIPALYGETSGEHVPQMLNLDRLDGISFSKGCYPGQEIVARLHYLGTLKRRLFVGHCPLRPARRAPVYAGDTPAQAIGEILDAVPDIDGYAVQAVLTLAAVEAGGLHVGDADGAPLTLHPASPADR